MNKAKQIVVGISVGDINGIGLEIILRSFDDKRMLEFCTPVLYASNRVVSIHKKILKLNTPIQRVHSIDSIIHGKINLINVWTEEATIEIGKTTKSGGKYAFLSLEAAVNDLRENAIDVLVTAPINKHTIQSEAFNFPGHTEYLQNKLNGESLMLLLADNLRVGLLTGHISLNKVTEAITPELIHKKVAVLHHTLKQDFSIAKPKIALLSIHPHAGDNGLIGKEDTAIVMPTIEVIQQEGKLVYGPYAADSFFGSGTYKNFDAVLATYHDQGLIPFKTLAFGQGVNFTAGLDKIRTSPDHGTAFDLAGKGVANISSFKEAVFTAISLHKIRAENRELEEQALK